jgi:hypothetical protein
MNKWDSSGFSCSWEDLELLRAQRYSLLEFPRRDLRAWTVWLADGGIGFVHQWGNSRFEALVTDATLIADTTLIAAYANLEPAVSAVEFAESLRAVSGICGGVRQ